MNPYFSKKSHLRCIAGGLYVAGNEEWVLTQPKQTSQGFLPMKWAKLHFTALATGIRQLMMTLQNLHTLQSLLQVLTQKALHGLTLAVYKSGVYREDTNNRRLNETHLKLNSYVIQFKALLISLSASVSAFIGNTVSSKYHLCHE